MWFTFSEKCCLKSSGLTFLCYYFEVVFYISFVLLLRTLKPCLLHLQVDAGLTFNKKDLEHSFIFDIKTIDRVFYLVADTEEEMNKWVRCICDICGFNPTDDGEDDGRHSLSNTHLGHCNIACICIHLYLKLILRILVWCSMCQPLNSTISHREQAARCLSRKERDVILSLSNSNTF